MKIEDILNKILEIPDLVSKKHSHGNKSIIDNITQALIDNWNAAFTHISDVVKHITSTERTNWNDANSKKHTHSNKSTLDTISQTNLNNWDDKYSRNEVDNKINQVVSSLDWKESVATYADIATTYPNPEDGWTVNVRDNDITYRYDGSAWISVSANSIPLASASVDGKMSKTDKSKLDGIAANANNYVHPANHPATIITEDTTHRFTTDTEKSNWNDANSKKHTHSNWSILESITQALLDSWSAAYTHISDTLKHITSTERTNWNEAYSKKHDHSNKSIIDTITQVLIDKWNAAYSHISDSVKHITSDERTLWNNKMSESDSWRNKPKILLANTDLNEIYQSGIYTGDSDGNSGTILNRPITTAQGFILHVHTVWSNEDISGRQVQIYIARDGKIFSRSKEQNGSWQSWQKVYSEIQKPTPADIGASATGHTHTKSQITDMPTKLSEFLNDSGFITQTDVDTSQNHTHANKSILDTITQTLINNWNAAYSHISDSVKHITSSERTLWNTVSNKVDKVAGKNLSTNDFDNSYKSKLDSISNNANKVETSTTNGNIKIDGVEKTIYTHPSGTNPHNTTKADIGLGNVDNTSDLSKPISTAVQTALNGKANSSHTHDDRYYTETEIDSKINIINSSIDGKANSSHTHNALVSIGRKTASDLPSTWSTGLYMTEVYNNSFPCSYGNCLTLKSSNTAITQICMEWKGSDATIGSMWIRNKRDSGADAWSSWREFSFTNHTHTKAQITDFPTSLPASGGNSDTVDGFHASQTAGSANTAVVRNSSGHILNTWFNSNRGSENTAAAQYLYDTGDGYMRKKDLVNVRAELVTAPFGLGGLAIDISSQDCNNIVNTGFYRGNNCTNRCPGSHTWTYLLVMGHDTSAWITQIGINYNNDGTYVRNKVNGTWTAWRRLDATNTSQLTNDSGFITASASITGNAATATKLQTARTIAIAGDIIGSANFDGGGNIIINTTLKTGLTWNDLKEV